MNRCHHNGMHPARAARTPSAAEAAIALSKELARGLWGIDMPRAAIIHRLPLFEVAMDGQDGMHTAVMRAARKKAA